ncbi:MAG: DUF4342 domain-containing protein [Chromatiaceae bacterium]|jgi:hypothetical protein
MNDDKRPRSVTEEVTLAGSELVDYVKRLITEGNVRRLIIRKPDGQVLVEVPLAAGIAVSGALTLMAPVLAALGAMAALVAQVRVEIVRAGGDGEEK